MNETRRTRRVVFGSVAAARPPATPAVGAVLERVYDSIAASAPAIAAPIIDRGRRGPHHARRAPRAAA
jgi:hypothetical protein